MKTTGLVPSPVFHSVGLGWGQGSCISHKLSDGEDAAGLGLTLGEPLR